VEIQDICLRLQLPLFDDRSREDFPILVPKNDDPLPTRGKD
jgi:hypothetical protein